MHRILVAASFVVALLNTATALAIQRTFVASNGADINPCNLAQPCRGFAAALLLTDPDGEIIVLDSAGYGPVTVTKPVSIIAPSGVYAGISVFAAQDGITVNAGAFDKVVLRGLSINGQGGNRGIVVTAAFEVHIEQCTIANMGSHGIEIDGGSHIHVTSSVARSNLGHGLVVGAGTPEVHLVDSQFSRNGNDGVQVQVGTLTATRIAANDNFIGLRVDVLTAVTATATLIDSAVTGNSTGVIAQSVFAGGTAALAVARSTSAKNTTRGFRAVTFFGGSAFLTVSDSASLENGGSGVEADGSNAIAIVSGSTLARNIGADLSQSGGAVLRSSLNNALTGRGAADISGTLTPNPLK